MSIIQIRMYLLLLYGISANMHKHRMQHIVVDDVTVTFILCYNLQGPPGRIGLPGKTGLPGEKVMLPFKYTKTLQLVAFANNCPFILSCVTDFVTNFGFIPHHPGNVRKQWNGRRPRQEGSSWGQGRVWSFRATRFRGSSRENRPAWKNSKTHSNTRIP